MYTQYKNKCDFKKGKKKKKERGRPPMGVNKAWHIKLRQNQVPPPAPRLGGVIHHGEQIPKSQPSVRDRL